MSENSQKSKLGEWYYEEMTPSQTILVIEPDGTKHAIKNGDMNSTQGRNLVARMFCSLKDHEAKFNRLNAISKENFDKLNYWQDQCIKTEKQRDCMLAAMIEARHALEFANDTPNGPICDTIWMMHRPETLFDFMDAAITSIKGGES